MLMGNFFKPAPTLRPMLNLGCLFDIPTGSYRLGKHGESILNGGLAYVTGIGGMGNTFKSTIAHFMLLRSLSRYTNAHSNVYDTEISLTMQRLVQLSDWMEGIGNGALEDSGRLLLTDKTIQSGNEWFESFKSYIREKRKDAKKYMAPTPFIDREGKNLEAFVPGIFEVDSFSQFEVDAVLSLYDKNEIGSAGLNMEAMSAARAKSQMINQIPGLTGSAGAYLIMTAHVGEEHQVDPYSPPKKKLAYLKGKLKFKNVPEKFTFLTNNCWYVTNCKPLQNQTTKGVEYPRHKDDVLVGDTDLNVVTLMNLRGKSGPAGMPFDLIVSQSEGVLVGLSEFNYIKSYGRYGIGGNDRNYYLELLPDVSLMRTTIRSKINEDVRLQRALEITSEMCQMGQMWHDLDEGLLCTPKELYEDLKAKGYDWDLLLGGTRGYWIFEDQPSDKYFLSTMDLLKMRQGTYHPWWYDEVAGKRPKGVTAP